MPVDQKHSYQTRNFYSLDYKKCRVSDKTAE